MKNSKSTDLYTDSSINPQRRDQVIDFASKAQNKRNLKIISKSARKNDIIYRGGDEEMDNNQILEKYIDLSNQNMVQIKEDMRLLDDRMGRNVENISTKIDKVIDEIHNMSERMNAKIDSTNKWIIGFVITTIISIIAFVITAIIAIV